MPTPSAIQAGAERGSGTAGTVFGNASPMTPSAAIAARSTASITRSGFTAPGRLSTGSVQSASMAPPAGIVAAPENATTP